jgi:hypothetical protein
MLSDTAGQRGCIYLRFVVNLTAPYSGGETIALRNQLVVEVREVVHPGRPRGVARHFQRYLLGLVKEREA